MNDVYELERVVRGLLSQDDGTSKVNPGDKDYQQMMANTRSIQEAIDEKHGAGGGAVVVPPGVFWIRRLSLPSFTELHLTVGCRLVAWPYARDYEPYQRVGTQEQEPHQRSVFGGISLIVSFDTDKAALTGRGTIDGNCFAFWDIPVREYPKQGGCEATWTSNHGGKRRAPSGGRRTKE